MSSGSLPFKTYHRASSLGAGTYGSVITVYDSDGKEFALKLFLDDDDDEDNEDEEDENENTDDDDDDDDDVNDREEESPIQLGTMRELSILRILRYENQHKNVIEMFDVKGKDDMGDDEDDNEGCSSTYGYLGMTMPLFPLGDLGHAINSKSLQNRRQVVRQISFGILSGVEYLHKNSIIHRDIKADNVMLKVVDNDDGVDIIMPVLIDFSLAKVIGGAMYHQSQNDDLSIDGIEALWNTKISSRNSNSRKKKTNNRKSLAANQKINKDASENNKIKHTTEVGTPTYRAPEIVSNQPYSFKSDLWSVGVILLEMFQNSTLKAEKDKEALRYIKGILNEFQQEQETNDGSTMKPFPKLIYSLLQEDPEIRLSAKEAITTSELFEKLTPEIRDLISSPINEKKTVDINTALPFDTEEKEESTQKKKLLQKRRKMVDEMCKELEVASQITPIAAMCYAEQMYISIDDTLDNVKESQTLQDCVILAAKFFELELLNLNELEEDGGCKGSNSKYFQNWSLRDYVDNESTIFMLMDYCLFPRKLKYLGYDK